MIEARKPTVLAVHADGGITVGVEGMDGNTPVTVLVRLPANLDRNAAKVEVVIPERLVSMSVDGRGFRHAIGSEGRLWTDRNGEWVAMEVGTERLYGLRCLEDKVFVVGEEGLRLQIGRAHV